MISSRSERETPTVPRIGHTGLSTFDLLSTNSKKHLTMAQSKSKKQQIATRWHDGTTPVDDLAPHELMAHQLVAEHRYLTPSVERIMGAELSTSQQLDALTAFRDSLGRIGDPNRDPRVAIASATAKRADD